MFIETKPGITVQLSFLNHIAQPGGSGDHDFKTRILKVTICSRMYGEYCKIKKHFPVFQYLRSGTEKIRKSQNSSPMSLYI